MPIHDGTIVAVHGVSEPAPTATAAHFGRASTRRTAITSNDAMLRNLNDMEKFSILATDGDIGNVKDSYFDDASWVIRYLIVETGSWLDSKKVLISPIAVNKPKWSDRVLPVMMTKAKVKQSPDIDTDKPVSLQNQMQYHDYYGYPYYWGLRKSCG